MDENLDWQMDMILGSVEVVAANLLPVLTESERKSFEKRAHFVRDEHGEICGGFDRDHWVDSMKMWKRNGECVETFISGCIPEWQSDLRKIASEEGLI